MGRRRSTFLRDTRGNLSFTTGVAGLLLMTAVGATLDGGQMFSTKQRLQSITDAAALTATMPDGISEARRKQLAINSIESHVEKVGGLNLSETTINVREAEGQVYVSLTADVPLLFGGVLGKDTRRVSASSLAEGSSAASMSALSISLVLDLSGSMGDRFDNGSKLASVNAAVSDMLNSINAEFGGDVAAATSISTGVYPFNWGMVDGETVALEPGTNTVLNSLTNLSLSNGSVPTTAMERAVADQLKEMKTRKNRDRFIVYVTDGNVEDDKSDIVGRYLRKPDMFTVKNDRACLKIAQELADLDEIMEPDLTNSRGLGSALSGVVQAVTLPTTGRGGRKNRISQIATSIKADWSNAGGNGNGNGLALGLNKNDPKMIRDLEGGKHAGHTHRNAEVMDKAKRVELRSEFLSLCQPTQSIRVAEACQEARDSGVSIIAINLSGEDGIATNATDTCINGIVLAEDEAMPKKKGKKKAPKVDTDMREARTLPSGIKVRVSADGKSYAGDATSLEELRDMLGSMLPSGEQSRSVRLVG